MGKVLVGLSGWTGVALGELRAVGDGESGGLGTEGTVVG